MKSHEIVLIISALLILLFTYTGLSKLLDFETFRGLMLNQPLHKSISSLLVWVVPTSELVSAGLLVIKPFRKIGLACSVLLMTGFTLYVGMVLSNAFDYVPCSCGGIMESLSWKAHLTVNMLFLVMALTGLTLEIRKRRVVTPAKKISR